MHFTTEEERRRLQSLDREALRCWQLDRLNRLLAKILPHNRFYAAKFSDISLPLASWDDIARLPFTFKDELASELHNGEIAANLTYPQENYVRFHRTSGTRGRPLVVLDTAEDWQWWLDVWQYVLDAADVQAGDRVLMAFSFGPFVGFWSAFDAVIARGSLAIPTGGMNTIARLELMRSVKATVVFTTPSYAMHMAETAAEHQINCASLGLKCIIVAGEPGGSAPETRERIESAWNCRVIDHAGATEVGPWGYADSGREGLRITESEFLPEFRSLDTGRPAREGEISELILTNLGRPGYPIIRYCTGDLVRPVWSQSDNHGFVLLAGGILGRVDDMMIVRGVNIFPASIERILHGFPEVVEYRMTARRQGALDDLTIEVEDRLECISRIAQELYVRLGLKIEVKSVPLGSLPRFDGKGKRFIDERPKAS